MQDLNHPPLHATVPAPSSSSTSTTTSTCTPPSFIEQVSTVPHKSQALPLAETVERQKRRRTSPQDHTILEAAFQQNSKPDKAARIEIASKVSLGDKEISIWFQNRRQVFRRRSRPVMSPMQFSSSFSMEPSSSQVTETPASSVPNTQAIDAPTKANAGVLSATGLTKHDVDGSAPVPKLKSAKWVSKAKLNTSFTLYDESQAQKSNPETSLPVSTTTDTPTLPASLKRAASQPRLHTSLDGSVRIKTADSPTPSPPRSQTDNPTRQPRNSGPLQRSQSAFVAPTFAAPGRSRDSRTWAFYCDSEARDELTKQAEREQSGSAVGAIGLIRSRSKGSFAATNKNNKRASSSVDAKKPSKKAQTSALAKRRANTLGAVKSTHPFVNQIIKDPSLGITNDRPKTDGKKKAITEFDTELDGNESDKENWAPGTQTVVSPVRRQTHRPANLPSARVLRDNSGIPSTSTSLGTMLGRSATSTPTLEKGKVTNPVKRNRLGVTKDEKEKPAKQGPEVNDDVKNMTEEKGKEEVSAKEEDLSCVQGLLSLSQGEWR